MKADAKKRRRKGEKNMVQQRPNAVGDRSGLSARAPEALQ
jgi:hypothetical protein